MTLRVETCSSMDTLYKVVFHVYMFIPYLKNSDPY